MGAASSTPVSSLMRSHGTLTKLGDADWEDMPIFGLKIPKGQVKDCPRELLHPSEAWAKNGQSKEAFDKAAKHLAGLFNTNFKDFADKCAPSVVAAGPKI